MGKKTPLKKKGPKGKKARAAAKLQRQWGEEVDENEVRMAKFRKGKSRLLGNAKSRIKSQPSRTHFSDANMLNYESNVTQVEDELSSEDSDYSFDDSVSKGNDRFLKKISKITKSRHVKSIESHLSDDEISYDDSNSMEKDDASHLEIDDKDHVEEEIMNFDLDQLSPVGENLYHSHFGMDPLPEDSGDSKQCQVMKKILSPGLHENFLVRLSADAKERLNSTSAVDIFSHVDKSLAQNWSKMNAKAWRMNSGHSGSSSERNMLFSDLQTALYPAVGSYCDCLITCTTRDNNDAIQNLMILHIVNHVLSANQYITSHNNRIRELEKRGEDVDSEDFRDQGYTRGKVLVLLPTKSSAHQFIKRMIEFLGEGNIVQNNERFETEYGPDPVGDVDDEATRKLRHFQKSKGPDWYELFSDEVKSDDEFKIGISFSNAKDRENKKKKKEQKDLNIKLYSEFYHSDIIIASPLGLKLATTNNEEDDGDADFLSSIEVCLVNRTDVLLMQNFDHVVGILGRLNQQPTKSSGIDFSRVRNYLLSGQAARWRQLIMISRFSDPHLISSFNRHSKSIKGKLTVRKRVSPDDASICDVMTKVRQVFQRVNCDSFLTQGDARVKYFSDVILPQLMQTKQKSTLVYIPSYFDFLAVRNVMLKHDVASKHFVSVTEYARNTEVSRGRHRFLQGRKRIMLYTGRAHFFLRHKIKGAKHLIMFGLPEYPEFYPELLNMLSTENQGDEEDGLDMPLSCLSLFSKYDAQCLERIVGTKHSERMIKGEKRTFLFNS
jgi:U3 small nucleolar RNA-associated protein 25